MEVLFPPFRLDLRDARLWRGEREIRLRPKTLAVLRYLAERPGRLVSTTELLSAVWPDVAVSDVMPRLCVRELRAALGDDVHAPRFIETRPGRGYQFVAPLLPLTAASAGSGRPPADPATGARPLVGRRADLEELGAARERACDGWRQTILVCGEPGIGKTSLVEAFVSGLSAHEVLWARGDCVEQYGAGEPYLPILAALERLGRSAGDPIISELRRTAPAWLVQLPSLIDPAEHAALAHRVAGSTRQRMLRELASALEAASGQRLLVLWLEDLHWADDSTLAALAFLARRTEPARLLLLCTFRPTELLASDARLAGLTHELTLHGHAREMRLIRLPEPDVAAYLAVRLAGRPVSSELVRHVHRRSDGNPLFMVTVADDLVGRALVVERGGEWTLDDARANRPGDVPDALRRLIEQHAGRLSAEDRRLLEAASVAGAEFSAASVAAALEEDQAAVEGRCARLARLGQFLASRGGIDWPDGTTAAAYGFVHALHHDVLYESIPAGQRRHLHARIAERLDRAFSGRPREIAAELAMHFTRARDTRRAVHYHRLAGEVALGRAANAEAIAHLSSALGTLDELPTGVERSRLELGLHFALGPAWIVIRGYAAPEVEHTYSRALELARELHDTREVTRALRGLWNVRLIRAEMPLARKLAVELLARARTSREAGALSFAHAALGETLFHAGDLPRARRHLERALALERRAAPARTSQRPRVAVYAAWALWLAGYPDRARRLCSEAVAEARVLARPHNRAFALGYASGVYQLCEDVSRVAELCAEQLAVFRDHDIPYWRSVAEVREGWVLARQGHAEEGALTTRRGIAAYRQTGSVLGATHLLRQLAEVYRDVGDVEAGLKVIEEAMALAVNTGDRCAEPDLHRVRGELLLRRPLDGAAAACQRLEAERCFRTAIRLARRRSARALELRAATCLARLWQERGESARARRLLAPLCRWFTEGADTADLNAARQLLTALEATTPEPRRGRAHRPAGRATGAVPGRRAAKRW
jgi:DNA-binding winged helix-turn-helix (wHTH) protein/tetratricopeptide (TPR) repeat protein